MKLRDPGHDITLYERNHSDDTFSWGVVLSDETMSNFGDNDPVSEKLIRDNFAYWDDVKVVRGAEAMTSGGMDFAALAGCGCCCCCNSARELGVRLEFQCDISDQRIGELKASHDVVVAADGLNSRTRTLYADQFRPDTDMRQNHFVWLGTKQKFDDAFTFIFEETEQGWIWAHAYEFDADTATFVV